MLETTLIFGPAKEERLCIDMFARPAANPGKIGSTITFSSISWLINLG